MIFRFFKKIKKTIGALFGKPWSDETFEELQQILYEADLGSQVAADFTNHLKGFLRKKPQSSIEEILQEMQRQALAILEKPPQVVPTAGIPLIILVVGVNGSGKTTSIAKLAQRFQKEGKSVLLAAGDTFRAAAIEQLTLWAEKIGAGIVKAQPGSDPSSVAFDAISAAVARKLDVVLIDTAGRLQNKADLMQELEKMRRVCGKALPGAPHETILILDSTIGQNALDQVTLFHKSTPLTGILLSKLDGSAKGGIVLALYNRFGIPVRWIGSGETADDLVPFDAKAYAAALFEGAS